MCINIHIYVRIHPPFAPNKLSIAFYPAIHVGTHFYIYIVFSIGECLYFLAFIGIRVVFSIYYIVSTNSEI